MDKANALTYFHIGLIFTKKNESEKALRAFDKAIELDSNNSDYYHNRGIVLLALGNFDQAIYNYKKAIDLGGNISLSKASLGLIEMRLKKFNAGWDNYEFRIDGLDGSKEILKICSENYAYWDGNKVCKGVLVIGEQGLGDIILFASLLPELIETELKIHLIIEPRLVNLFRRSFKNITITPQIKENFSIQFLKNMSFDQYILIGSLGKFYRKSLDDFKNNPEITLTNIFNFLGVNPSNYVFTHSIHNDSNFTISMLPETRNHLLNIFTKNILQVEQLLNWDCSDWLK